MKRAETFRCIVLGLSIGFGLIMTPAQAADLKLAGKTVPSDQDKNGKPEHWETYDGRGVKVMIASDTNADGKPDSWKHPIRAMNILRERDKNFDGKVDERMVTDLLYDNNLKFSRHLPLWRESDDDFDGVIDVYRVRGENTPNPDRRGQRVDIAPWSIDKEVAIAKARADAAASASMEKTQVEQMNSKQKLAG